MENETAQLEHSNYYNDADFKSVLHNANSKISMLSLNCQSINAKYDKLTLSGPGGGGIFAPPLDFSLY